MRCFALLLSLLAVGCGRTGGTTSSVAPNRVTFREDIVYQGVSLPRWKDRLWDRDEQTRRDAANALVAIGTDAIPVLTQALKSGNADLKIFAAQTLGDMGKAATPAIPDLQAARKDPEIQGDDRLRVMRAIGEIEGWLTVHLDDDSEKAMNLIATKDSDPDKRAIAQRYVSKSGLPRK